jgi:hypothetical protein
MRDGMMSQLTFFNEEIIRKEYEINDIAYDIKRVESKYRELDMSKDREYYEKKIETSIKNIRSLLGTCHKNTDTLIVKEICSSLVGLYNGLVKQEFNLSTYLDWHDAKEYIEKQQLKLDECKNQRCRLVRKKAIVEYLHSNLTDDILDDFMKLIKG